MVLYMNSACLNCPLCQNAQVPPKSSIGPAKLIILNDHPRPGEVDRGKFSVGAAGFLLKNALRGHCSIDSVHITGAVLCYPELTTEDGITRGLSPSEWARALACCRPRLEAELAAVRFSPEIRTKLILALGEKALKAALNKTGIKAYQLVAYESTFVDLHVFPLVHPASALKKPPVIPVVEYGIRRALRYATVGIPTWDWGPMVTEDGPEALEALEQLLRDGLPLGVDVETAGIDPMSAPLLCLGVANSLRAVSLEYPLSPSAHAAFSAVLSSPLPKVLHNGQYDVLSLKAHGFHLENFEWDTLLLHHICAPQLPHDLGFVSALFYDAPRWKTEFHVSSDFKGSEAFTKRDPKERRLYNAKDASMTAKIFEPLWKHVSKRVLNGEKLYREAQALQQVAMRMKERGVLIDPTPREGHRARCLEEMQRCAEVCERVAPGVQLGKTGQHSSLNKLFFVTLKESPVRYTAEGKPSLDKATLEGIMTWGHSGQAKDLAYHVLQFRKHAKLVSTYLDGLPVSPVDGLLHPTWKVHGAVTGRWSSSTPNFQNWPKAMRDMAVARPGCQIVHADYAQLELRLIALLAGDEQLLEAFAKGEDVHTLNAAMIFNKAIRDVNKGFERDFAKTFVYLANYGGTPDKLLESLVARGFHKVNLYQCRKLLDNWYKAHPELLEFQNALLRVAEEEGYVEDPLSGRRTHFHDGRVEPNKVRNFPIQGAAATLMNKAILAADAALRWEDGEGILAQVHDALYLEGSNRERLTDVLHSCMEQTIIHNGNEMRFTVDVSWGPNFKELKHG